MPELPTKVVVPYFNKIPLDREKHNLGLGNFYKKKYEGDVNILGIGGERIVVSDGENAVALVYFGDKYMALATFYIHRLLHTLYPKNFPRFKAIYYAAQEQVTVEFREKITYESNYNPMDPALFSIDKVSQQLSSWGITNLGGNGVFGGEYLNLWFKNTGLVVEESGVTYEVFLDAVKPNNLDMNKWDFKKIYESLIKQRYSGHDIKAVLNAILRISVLSIKKLALINASKNNEEMHPSVVTENILSDEQIKYIKSVLLTI